MGKNDAPITEGTSEKIKHKNNCSTLVKSDRARIFNTTTLRIVICLASKFLNCSPKIQEFLLVKLSMIMARPLPLVPYSSLVPVFDSSAMYSRPSPSLFQLHEVHPSLCSQS